jgi:hypothetical protein
MIFRNKEFACTFLRDPTFMPSIPSCKPGGTEPAPAVVPSEQAPLKEASK